MKYTLIVRFLVAFMVASVLSAETASVSPKVEGPVYKMPAFKTFAEMVQVRPFSSKDGKGLQGLFVSNVLEGSSAAKVGLKRGMIIVAIQDMNVVGMPPATLVDATINLRRNLDNTIAVKAKSSPGSAESVIFMVTLPGNRTQPGDRTQVVASRE